MATIGTHSGAFQADEALGVWLLRQLPQYESAPLIRSRDMEKLKPLTIVIDVAGTYDHDLLRYDHHQRGFFETFDGENKAAKDGGRPDVTGPETATGEFKTKLSASGLVYKHYGREVLIRLHPSLSANPDALDWVYRKMYDDVMMKAISLMMKAISLMMKAISLMIASDDHNECDGLPPSSGMRTSWRPSTATTTSQGDLDPAACECSPRRPRLPTGALQGDLDPASPRAPAQCAMERTQGRPHRRRALRDGLSAVRCRVWRDASLYCRVRAPGTRDRRDRTPGAHGRACIRPCDLLRGWRLSLEDASVREAPTDGHRVPLIAYDCLCHLYVRLRLMATEYH